jgi:DNA-binding SARP family transcriptional activator
VEAGGAALEGLRGAKVRELFAYLLVHRGRPHARESLANVLWSDASGCQSKKYLRQALWQLQAVLKTGAYAERGPLLLVDPEWIQLDGSGLWLDMAELEDAFENVREVPGEAMEEGAAGALERAVELYRGELLEGWFADWCAFERERLRGIYLSALDKLMQYCEARHRIEAGLRFGSSSLRVDRARESAHQSLMRLHALGGDRAEALRQYDRCVIALDEELGVGPAQASVDLYRRVKERVSARSPAPQETTPDAAKAGTLREVLERLRKFESALSGMKSEVQNEILLVEAALEAGRPPAGRPALRRAG